MPPTEAEKQLLSPDQQQLLVLPPSLHQDATNKQWSLQVPNDGVPGHRLYVPHALWHRIIEAALLVSRGMPGLMQLLTFAERDCSCSASSLTYTA